ncbi:MAG: SprT-like domain-containing protein [Halioglobus sp.]|nr:SprT-like domain-containing protein [Halioglobus sp.]
MVEPISDSQRLLVSQRTESYIARAEVLFDRQFPRIPVTFDLRGATAGMFRRAGRRCEIRYNPWIFGKYFLENLRDTVPHEVAHYIVYAVHGARRIKPHGTQWRDLMARFGADPGVTFDLDLEGVPRRRQRTHSYRCDCGLHALSTTRHNRIQRGRGSYQCRACHGLLVYTSC